MPGVRKTSPGCLAAPRLLPTQGGREMAEPKTVLGLRLEPESAVVA